jgi:hypothetical protein
MITEGSQTPRSIPWHNAPGIPVAQMLLGDEGLMPGELLPGGRRYEAVKQCMDAIPAGAPAVFNQWIKTSTLNASMRVLMGSWLALTADATRVSDQYRSVASGNWAGVYDYSGPMRQNGITLFSLGVPLVHEYGHHIDWRYNEFVRGTVGLLTNSAPFSTLATASLPGIPMGTYAKTNAQEWFAEAFTALLTGINNNVSNTDASFITHIAGGDATRAGEIKTAFYALFPGLFPTFPVAPAAVTVPTVVHQIHTARDGNGTGAFTPTAPAYLYLSATAPGSDQATISSSAASIVYTHLAVMATGDEAHNLLVSWQRSADGSTWEEIVTGLSYTNHYLTYINAPDVAKPFIRARITNSAGEVFTSAYQLQIIPSPTITTQPTSVSALQGASLSFTVAATGYTSLKWQSAMGGLGGWTDVAGGTSPTLNLVSGNGDATNGMYFRAILFNGGAYHRISNNASLTIPAPAINTQPTGGSFVIGDAISMSAVASGFTTRQWQSSPNGATWTDIAGATTGTLSGTAGTAPFTSGTVYIRCTYSNSYGGTTVTDIATVASNAALVAPVITTQPTGGTFAYAAAISVSAAATGATSQQWQQSANGTTGWTSIAGATATTVSGNAGTAPFSTGTLYVRCAFTNAAGTTNTSAVSVVASAPVAPTVTTQPIAADYAIAAAVSLTAAATGATSQKWQSSPDNSTWTDIAGATATTWSGTAGTAPAVNGPVYFRCVFAGPGGTSTNTSAVIVGTKYLTIDTTTRLSINGVNSGSATNVPSSAGTVTLSLPSVAGYPAPTYQWRTGANSLNATMSNISGATSSTYSAAWNTGVMLQGKYFRAVITNSVGSYIANANQLTLGTAPTVSVQPDTTAHTYTLASATVLNLTAASTGGDLAPTVQWSYLKNGTTTVSISGATTTSLSIALSAANGFTTGTYQFQCVFTNQRVPTGAGTNYSGTITLT